MYNQLFNVGIYIIAFTGYVWSGTRLTPYIVDVDYMGQPVPVTLTCTYNESRPQKILWSLYHVEGDIQYKGTVFISGCVGQDIHRIYSYTCSDNYVSLSIPDITWRNNGDRWMCTTIDYSSMNSSNVCLINVKVPIQDIVLTQPTNDTITVVEDSEVSFVCTTSEGLPSPDITWYNDNGTPATTDDDVEIRTNTTTFSSDVDKSGLRYSTGKLTFYPQLSDNGTRLYCAANNTDSSLVVSTRKPLLNVLCKTWISSFVVEGKTGHTVTVDEITSHNLTCNVDSNSSSNIVTRIQFRDKILKEEESSTQLTLQLSHVSYHDIGVYTCIIGHDLNQTCVTEELILNVNCEPQPLGNFPYIVYGTLHEPVSLQVDIVAYPAVMNYFWWKNNTNEDRQRPNNCSKVRIPHKYIDVTRYIYAIDNVTQADFDEYTVRIKNPVGILKKTIVLKQKDNENHFNLSVHQVQAMDTREPLRQTATTLPTAIGISVAVMILLGVVVVTVSFILRRRRATKENSDSHITNRIVQKDADTTEEDEHFYEYISDVLPDNPSNSDVIHYYDDAVSCPVKSDNHDTTYNNEEAKGNSYESLNQQGQGPAMYRSLEPAGFKDQTRGNSDKTRKQYENLGMEKLKPIERT